MMFTRIRARTILDREYRGKTVDDHGCSANWSQILFRSRKFNGLFGIDKNDCANYVIKDREKRKEDQNANP